MPTDITVTPSYSGEPLVDILRRKEIDMSFPCSGRQKCGKCLIKINGPTEPAGNNEIGLLGSKYFEDDYRLACFVKLVDTCRVSIPEEEWQQIMDEGYVQQDPVNPAMSTGNFGVAIDIGTTTIVCSIFGTDSGSPLAVKSQINKQVRYGAEVLSRIKYGMKNGFNILQKTVVEQIEKMLLSACQEADIPRVRLTHAVVTGNTTMLHFFCGMDATGIGQAPFTTESLFGCEAAGFLEGIITYFPSCISAYVGADLVCSILASKITSDKESSIVVDIGTNGEMALFHNEEIICCATAAGPAFEGTTLSHGMLAENGAIAKVEYIPRAGIIYTTIGNKVARGICGSAIIDVVAALLDSGALLPSGRLQTKNHPLVEDIALDPVRFIFPNTNVSLSQMDVRQIQLAKAAIRAGIDILLEFGKMDSKVANRLFLCGGFGSYLNLKSAERIGLIPDGSVGKTTVIGNGALGGATMLLLDSNIRTLEQTIVQKCRYIELSSNSRFMEQYIESMDLLGGKNQ